MAASVYTHRENALMAHYARAGSRIAQQCGELWPIEQDHGGPQAAAIIVPSHLAAQHSCYRVRRQIMVKVEVTTAPLLVAQMEPGWPRQRLVLCREDQRGIVRWQFSRTQNLLQREVFDCDHPKRFPPVAKFRLRQRVGGRPRSQHETSRRAMKY